MNLLEGGPGYEPCTVYPEVVITDSDGNPRTQPSTTGIPAKARFQLLMQTGTSFRTQEQDNEGFESDRRYQMRFPKSFTAQYGVLGAQSELDWHGARWAIFGDADRCSSSPRTAHLIYTIRRT
jgi:hypothetical protein